MDITASRIIPFPAHRIRQRRALPVGVYWLMALAISGLLWMAAIYGTVALLS